MKKILILLSIFLLTNISFANSFQELKSENLINGATNIESYEIISWFEISWDSLMLFFVLFVIGMTKIIIYNKKIFKTDSLEEQKKLSNKSSLFVIVLLCILGVHLFAEWINWVGTIAEPLGGRRPFIFYNIKEYIVLVTLFLLILVIKLIRNKKRLLYKILFYSLIFVLIIVVCILAFNYFRIILM